MPESYPWTIAAKTTLCLTWSLLLVGCSFAKIGEKEIAAPPRRMAGITPAQIKERESRPPRLAATVSGDVIDVVNTTNVECRSVHLVAMEQERTTERRIDGAYGFATNSSPQFWNVVTALTMGGTGAALVAWDCTHAEDPCSQKEITGFRTTGVVLLGLAGIAVAAFTTNAIRAADSHATVPVSPERLPDEWATCESQPIPSQPIAVAIGRTSLTTTTRGDGHATVNLGDLSVNDDELSPTARLSIPGEVGIEVDLRSTPSFARWRSAAEERARARQRANVVEQIAKAAKNVTTCESTMDARTKRRRHQQLLQSREPAEYVQKRCTPRREMFTVRGECRDANNFIRPCTKQSAGDIIGYSCGKNLDQDMVKLGMLQLGLSSGSAFPEDREIGVTDAWCDGVMAEKARLDEELRVLEKNAIP